VACLVAAAVTGVILVEGLATERDLESVSAEAAALRGALATSDLDAAGAAIARARTNVDRAVVRTGRAHWLVLERVLVVGRSIGITRETVAVAAAAVDVAEAALGADMFHADWLSSILADDGGVDLAALDHARARFDSLPVPVLESAHARLDATADSLIPRRVRDGRRRALGHAEHGLALAERARTTLRVLPSYLGADEPRRYLLAMQNPSELRGTGGLVGFIAVLTIAEGRFELSEPQTYSVLHEDLEAAVALAGNQVRVDDLNALLDPVYTSSEFSARYGHTGAAGFFGNTNLDPDLPTSAPVMLDLYEARTGQRLDGLVVMDPIGIALLLEARGPLPVPPHVRDPDGRIPAELAPADLPRVTMIDAYDVFGGPSPERREFLRAVAEGVFEQLLTGPWEADVLARQLVTASSRRTLQLYSRVPDEQRAFELLGVAGVMGAGSPDGDLLAVTANNVAGNKMDVHVAHRITASIALAVPGILGDEAGSPGDGGPAGGGASAVVWATRSARVHVELDNPLPSTGRDLHIIGNCLPSTTVLQCFDGPPGLSRTWFTVWSPAGTELVAARDDGGVPLVLAWGHIHGHRAFDHYLEVPSRSAAGFEVDLVGPARLVRDGPDLLYGLTLWRQAKAIPDHVDLTLTGPRGWTVADVRVTGGGDGRGMGVGGDGSPVDVWVEDGRVRIIGAVTADLDVEVRYSRGLLKRLLGR
jgi:hypothetical protein